MMFQSSRLLIGGYEFLKLFSTSNYTQFIKMMLLYEESYRETHFYSLGKLPNYVCNSVNRPNDILVVNVVMILLFQVLGQICPPLVATRMLNLMRYVLYFCWSCILPLCTPVCPLVGRLVGP